MSRLADPKILMAIRGLPLAAKTAVDGFMAGIHAGTLKGEGMEFSQYRSYQAGDDLRRLDWKMFARSDRYYIRESEIETSISVRFLIDASASMNHEDNGISKMEYARLLAASLAYLAAKQHDATGLYIFKPGGVYALPLKKDHQHLSRLFHQLERIEPEGQFTNPMHYQEIFRGSGKKEMLIFITDFYEEHGEISKLLSSLAASRHEIIVFHLMGSNERNLDYAGFTSLQDLETGQKVRIDATEVKKNYAARLNAHLSAIRESLLEKHIFYGLIYTDQPLDQALVDFLKQRNKIIR